MTHAPASWRIDLRWPGAGLVLAAGLVACGHPGTQLRGGRKAPAFSRTAVAPGQALDGTPISLEKLRADGPVMLVFLRGFG
jgi:hypothetical protein